MKYFKISPSRTAARFEITADTFQNVTGNIQPFEQKNRSGKFSRYGICPSCLNPIQLIGLYSESERRPYGRHTGKNIDGLPEWNYEKYKYCPFATNKPGEPNDDDLIKIDNNVVELYDLLKTQFDRVAYIISDELKIHFTGYFWEKAMRQFLINKAYCYPWLTEVNLPYVFAYRGMHQQDIWGQKFLVNSELFNVLKHHPNVNFEKTGGDYMFLNKKHEYLHLQLRFSKHKQIGKDGEDLRETMMLYVDDMVSGGTIFEKKIEFDETHFIRMVEKKGNEDKRQQWLLDIAEKLMPPLARD